MIGKSEFNYRDRVIIDGGADLVAVVTGFFFRETGVFVEICWFANGDAKEARIEDWRLKLAEE